DEDVGTPRDACDHQCAAQRAQKGIALASLLLKRHLPVMRTVLIGLTLGSWPIVVCDFLLRIQQKDFDVIRAETQITKVTWEGLPHVLPRSTVIPLFRDHEQSCRCCTRGLRDACADLGGRSIG